MLRSAWTTVEPVSDAGATACDFCDHAALRRSAVLVENDLCMYVSTPRIAEPEEVLPGSGIVIPLAHRRSPFELTAGEWGATRELLVAARDLLARHWAPDGYTIGWNCGPAGGQEVEHVHLHVIPRFADEPHAGHGIRWAIKRADNRRADPLAHGQCLG